MSDDDSTLVAVGRVELVEHYQSRRHELAMCFAEDPEQFGLLVQSDDEDGLMLVKEHEGGEP